MNERFVAVSTVTRSRICGCFAKPRRDFSVTRGWQQMMNAIRWIKQSAAEEISTIEEQQAVLNLSVHLMKLIWPLAFTTYCLF